MLHHRVAAIPGGQLPAVAFRSGDDVVVVSDPAYRLHWLLEGMEHLSAEAINALLAAMCSDGPGLLQLVS